MNFDALRKRGGKGFTYRDLIVLPGTRTIDFPADEVDLSCHLTRNITLKIPLVSSPMDRVTESEMAIALALQGGIGFIHCNNTIEEQARAVRRVKRYNNGFITDPEVLSPEDTVADLRAIQERTGYTSYPIVDENGTLVGIVTQTDYDFEQNEVCLRDIMSTDLSVARVGCTLAEARAQLKSAKVKKLPVVDEAGRLISMVCRKDISNAKEFPLATMDATTKQLLVGAAVSTQKDSHDRVRALVEAGADVILIDSAQGDSIYQHDLIRHIKAEYDVDVIAGNIVTWTQGKRLVDAGADGLRVGMGTGSICITQQECGVGRSQCAAVFDVFSDGAIVDKIWKSQRLMNRTVPIIADGGITGSADIFKALALGANTVMVGSLLAGTEESPGKSYFKQGVQLKEYRGMGSKEVLMEKGKGRYLYQKELLAQGVVGAVTAKGSVHKFVPPLMGYVRHSMQYCGLSTVTDLHTALRRNELLFEIQSHAAISQSGAHNLYEISS